MCEYCNKPYKNMSVNGGKMIIKRDKYSPSGYILFSDNSGGEYAECYCVAWYCPMCGRKLSGTEE